MQSLEIQENGRELIGLAEEVKLMAALCSQIATQVIPGTALAAGEWPKAAEKARLAYDRSRQEMASAAQAVSETSNAVYSAIDTVLRNYNIADYESTIAAESGKDSRYTSLDGFGRNPPRPRWGADLLPKASTAATAVEGGGVAALTAGRTFKAALQGWKLADGGLAQLSKASAWAGASVVTDFAYHLYVWPNLKDAHPFSAVADRWHGVSDALSKALEGDATRGLKKHLPVKGWEGSAASAFNKYMSHEHLPVIQELKSLADSHDKLCTVIATTMDSYATHQWELAAGTAGALTAAAVFRGTTFTYYLAGLYCAATASSAAVLSGHSDQISEQVKEVTKRANELISRCRSKSPKRDDILLGHFNKKVLGANGGGWLPEFRPVS
jgi:hypothetical protein